MLTSSLNRGSSCRVSSTGRYGWSWPIEDERLTCHRRRINSSSYRTTAKTRRSGTNLSHSLADLASESPSCHTHEARVDVERRCCPKVHTPRVRQTRRSRSRVDQRTGSLTSRLPTDCADPHAASSPPSAASRNRASAGLNVGFPALCPHIDGIGSRAAFANCATSRRLSSTVK